jgi:hypothetical protein
MDLEGTHGLFIVDRNRGLFWNGGVPAILFMERGPPQTWNFRSLMDPFTLVPDFWLVASSAPGSGLGGMMPTAWSSESVRYLYSVAAVSAVRRLEWALTALETSKYRLPVP